MLKIFAPISNSVFNITPIIQLDPRHEPPVIQPMVPPPPSAVQLTQQ